MKTHVRKLLALLATASVWPLAAQTPAPVPANPSEEEIIELSPFEVTASSDVGYQATETLAGTRIRTDLKDVGSAISVATKEFMRDIGATDSQTLLQYMTSTEVGGTGGNFGGLGDGATLNDNQARLQPNNSTRVRGLDSADNTRDFFITDIPFDTYNTSRIDIQRGANSILFGNGSGAGIINGATDPASFGKNSAVVSARYGSYGSKRGSLNINRVLLPKQLAIRVAALDDKRMYRQEPAYNHDKRLYGAVRFDPAFLNRGSAHTSLKVSYENGKVDANRPRTSTPIDMISPWFLTSARDMVSPTPYNAKGDTVLGRIQPMLYHGGYNPFTVNLNNAALITANPTDRGIGARAGGNANSEPWMSFGSNNNIFNDWQGGFAAVYNDQNAAKASFYLNPGTSNLTTYYAVNSLGNRDGTITGLRMPTFDGILPFSGYASAAVGEPFVLNGNTTATAGFKGQASGVYRDLTISDPTVYDFYNKLIDGPNKREFSKFDVVSVSLDQTFFNDKAGFQLSYDQQTYLYGQSNELGGQPVLTLDIWKYLPAALPDENGLLQPVLNPNFGRPFTASGRGIYERHKRTRTVWRATPFLDLDFKELLKTDNWATKVLGRHSITGLIENNKYQSKDLSGPYNYLPQDIATTFLGPGGTIGDTNRKVVVLTYLGNNITGSSTLAGANISNIKAVQNPGAAPAIVFNPTYKANAPAPGAAYTPPAIGLSPSQVGGNATTQSENPANYVGWSSPTALAVSNLNTDGLVATGSSERRDETRSYAVVDQWGLLDRSIVLTGGMRKDRIASFVPGVDANGNYTGNGNRRINSYGMSDFDAAFPYPSSPTSKFTSEWLKTWSIVGHSPQWLNKKLPFGLTGSVFYSHSENFRPANRIDIYGNHLAPPHGTTKDYGVLIGALDGRVSLKITRYDTKVFDADLGDTTSNNTRTRIGDEIRNAIQYSLDIQNHVGGYSFTTPLNPGATYAVRPTLHVDGSLVTSSSPATLADWNQAESNIQAAAVHALANSLPSAGAKTAAVLATYGIVPSQWTTTSPTLTQSYKSGLTITGDTVSKGTEYELFLRPTDNWNITVNAAKTFASRVALASAVSDWLESRWALYIASANGPLKSIGDIPWFGDGGDTNAARVNTTGLARFSRNAWQFYQQFRAQEGNAVPELRPWRVNIVTNYNFTHEKLKGVFVGASYRWQDRNVIGYGYTETTPRVSASSPDLGKLDVTKPFYGPKEEAIDLWVGYQRKILKNVDWRIQLNVINAFDEAHLVPINTNPDGSIGSWRIADGASWQVTNTFTF